MPLSVYVFWFTENLENHRKVIKRLTNQRKWKWQRCQRFHQWNPVASCAHIRHFYKQLKILFSQFLSSSCVLISNLQELALQWRPLWFTCKFSCCVYLQWSALILQATYTGYSTSRCKKCSLTLFLLSLFHIVSVTCDLTGSFPCITRPSLCGPFSWGQTWHRSAQTSDACRDKTYQLTGARLIEKK